MIAKLIGTIDSVDLDSFVIDVGGVGYLVYASGKTLSALPGTGEPATVLIAPLVRQEQMDLFGFLTTQERQWFRILLGVQGVGAKVALAMLTSLTPQEIEQAIFAQDKAMISRADGVGPKLAARILSELKDTVAKLSSTLGAVSMEPAAASSLSEAISALTHLGYSRHEATQAVAKAQQQHGVTAPPEALIRAALGFLSQNMSLNYV